jgi:hypothetical protein
MEGIKPEGVPEEIDMILQRRNYNLMNEEMVKILRTESIGGNAGTTQIGEKWFACAAANGYADSVTGEILAFGNSQDLPEEISEKGKLLTFKVAKDMRGEFRKFHGGFFKVVEVYGKQLLSPQAQRMIEACVEQYNTIDVKRVKKLA